VKDSPEAHKARNDKWNKERLKKAERDQLELAEGRSIPLRKLRHTVADFLTNGPRKPKPLPVPGVVDLTPISDETIAYWTTQGYVLADVQDDPFYQAEILQANKEQIEKRKRSEPFDPNQFGPKDPSHPYAYTPRYVTFAMRRNQGFKCHVMGWHESDWVFNKMTGEVRLVGKLTRDHTKAAVHGGATSHDNLKMVAAMVNRKKGCKYVTYEQLRDHLSQFWEIFQLSPNERFALDHFASRGVRHITL